MVVWPDIYHTLVEWPYMNGWRRLSIVTAYTSSSFLDHVLTQFPDVHLEIIVGMTKTHPPTIWEHNDYLCLTRTGRFTLHYYISQPAVHLKTVLWMPVDSSAREIAYVGSADFNWNGFTRQQELMMPVDPAFVHKLRPSSDGVIDCTHPDVFKEVMPTFRLEGTNAVDTSALWLEACQRPYITLPLTEARSRRVHARSGLNWGQREGREPNQAYLSVPRAVHRNRPGFLPEPRREFNVVTDDGESFICVVAQDSAKAIETKRDNSILGKYFRRRLGVPLGQRVETRHLHRYGRFDVSLYKLGPDAYFLDFRP